MLWKSFANLRTIFFYGELVFSISLKLYFKSIAALKMFYSNFTIDFYIYCDGFHRSLSSTSEAIFEGSLLFFTKHVATITNEYEKCYEKYYYRCQDQGQCGRLIVRECWIQFMILWQQLEVD